ncbi:MAG: hypothetical protein AB7S57_09120 [Acetobacteraceae bacterium]
MTSLGQGMAGLVLVLAFAQLCTRQLGAVLTLTIAQALAVAVALAAREHWVAAAIAAATAAALPMAVSRLRALHPIPPQADPPAGVRPALVAAAVLGLLAVQFPVLGLPLGVVLSGLMLVATRPHAVMRALGLSVMQFGSALAYGSVAPVLLDPMAIAATLPVVPGLMLARAFLPLPAGTRRA